MEEETKLKTSKHEKSGIKQSHSSWRQSDRLGTSWCSENDLRTSLVVDLVRNILRTMNWNGAHVQKYADVAGITVEMAQCWTWTHWSAALSRANKWALDRAEHTLLNCCRHLSASVPFRVNNCANLLKPFSDILDCEHLHKCCTSNSVAIWTRTMHSSSCIYHEANWITRCTLLNSCRNVGDMSLRRTLNKFSVTSNHVCNHRTVGLTQSACSKSYQKWSLSRVTQQLVCHHVSFVLNLSVLSVKDQIFVPKILLKPGVIFSDWFAVCSHFWYFVFCDYL